MGPTMDHQIIRGLFGDTASPPAACSASTPNCAAQARRTCARRSPPTRSARYGQLQEWLEDKDDPKNQHRHVSHLWGVYPGAEITPWHDQELFARRAAVARSSAATRPPAGAWAGRSISGRASSTAITPICILSNLFSPTARQGQGGLYPNLFDAHPPFQIDGNFGGDRRHRRDAVAEPRPIRHPATVPDPQSAFIHLLPALPSAFPNGSVTGLRARGAIEVDIAWRNGKLIEATLRPSQPKAVKVRYAGKQIEIKAQPGKVYKLGADLRY